jgi:alkanesulfonate monooxygenase SsuD/methylene tetrahydromethanopterin reductase-like flavin-dependent oxidoreductase (luciferase family)
MRLGNSLRFVYPSGPDSMQRYQDHVVPRGEFSDIPLGTQDVRQQAANLLELAATTAETGFDFLLVGDSHAVALFNAFAPTPTLARMLAVTGDMPVGLLYLAPFHHPVIAAEQIGTLAAFAPEPITLVLGSGDISAAFNAFGITKASRARRTEEQIQLIRRLLAGESVTHSSPYVTLNNASINPIPRVPTPIWIAAQKGASIERAGRLGDGWETAPGTSPELLVEQLEVYRRACAESGRTPNPVLRRDIFVAATDEEAWAAVEPVLAAGYRGFGQERENSLVGSAETVVERLRYYCGLGFEFVLVRHIVGDHGLILDSMRRIGDDVLPKIRDLAPPKRS